MSFRILLPGRQSSNTMFPRMKFASGAALCVKDLNMQVSEICILVLAGGIIQEQSTYNNNHEPSGAEFV